MARYINGMLMLGWEVEVEQAVNYDAYDKLNEAAIDRLSEVLYSEKKFSLVYDVTEVPSVYYKCDSMWVGLPLMNSWSGQTFKTGDYGRFLADNADLLEEKARAVYEAVMGKSPDTPPMIMCLGIEG